MAALLLSALGASTASASSTQQSILTDSQGLYGAGAPHTIDVAKSLGFSMVKLPVQWNNAVPSAHSTSKPAGFNPTSAASYNAAFFQQLDAAVAEAKKDGVTVGFEFLGPGPVWAQGAGAPSEFKSASYFNNGIWKPNTTYFQDFVQVIAKRYPTVKWYSIWNEPNFGTNLAPQIVGKTDEGAILYRGLLDAAYKGLSAAGKTVHNSTIVIGELAPRYQKGTTLGGVRPLQFMDNLYGVSTAGKRLTGSAAKTYAATGSAAAFRKAHPLLFSNGGVAIHPYEQGVAPIYPTYTCSSGACWNKKSYDPLYGDFASIGRIESTLDRNNRALGSGDKPPLWNTEDGYSYTGAGLKTCHGGLADCAVSMATAAYYSNWTEYLSFKSSRIESFDQYQLVQPAGKAQTWADGLLTPAGKPTAVESAFIMPLFAPTSTLKKAGNLGVWGGVRPYIYNALTYKVAKQVQVQYAPKGGAYKTLKTVNLTNSRGYFTASVPVTKSGSLRLAYKLGAATLYSRTQAITVK